MTSLRHFGYAFILCAFTGLLADCGGSVPTLTPRSLSQSATADGKTSTYLYLAGSTSRSRGPFIDRFRLVKGVPVNHPDRVYQGYGGLIAVSGNGTLYVTGPLQDISVFPPHADKPGRQINVAPHCGPSSFTVFNAIAADRNGYLFVLIYSYDGLKRSGTMRLRDPATRTPCNGVAIYAPNANGWAAPVQSIAFSQGFGFNGLAVDDNDNLYVSENYPTEVLEYSNAITNPTLTRTFASKYLGTVRSVATDASGDIYIANAQQSFSSGWIDRYAPSASGSGPPTSAVYLTGSGPHLLDSIAVRGHYLYADDTGQSVELYHARKNGKQKPLDSIPASNVSSVAVGP